MRKFDLELNHVEGGVQIEGDAAEEQRSIVFWEIWAWNAPIIGVTHPDHRDGTCRTWRRRVGTVAPLLLRVDGPLNLTFSLHAVGTLGVTVALTIHPQQVIVLFREELQQMTQWSLAE